MRIFTVLCRTDSYENIGANRDVYWYVTADKYARKPSRFHKKGVDV